MLVPVVPQPRLPIVLIAATMDASSLGEPSSRRGEIGGEDIEVMDTESEVRGAIIDSWVESAGPSETGHRLVLQVAPHGRPEDLLIVEAATSLVPDRCWLEDLGENLCHGSPVAAVGRLTIRGFIAATQLHLAR